MKSDTTAIKHERVDHYGDAELPEYDMNRDDLPASPW